MDPNAFPVDELTQILIGGIWPMIFQFMKDSNWPIFKLIANSRPIANNFISGLIAFATTAGIHLTYMDIASGAHVLTLTIPPTTVLVHAGLQWVEQHIIYVVAIKNPEATKVQNALLQSLLDHYKQQTEALPQMHNDNLEALKNINNTLVNLQTKA